MKSIALVAGVAAFALILVSTGYAQQSAEQLFQSAIYKEEVEGELDAAIKIYKTIIDEYPENRSAAAKALLHTGLCYEKLGNAQASKAYERVVRNFADQVEVVAQARVRLAALGGSGGKESAGGLVARRILTDASGVRGVLTEDGKYISYLDQSTGDVVQFEVASGQTSRIKNRGPWGYTDKSYDFHVLSRDGKQIAYDSWTDTIKWNPEVRIRNLDGSGLRTLYSKKVYVKLLDWSPDAGSILACRYSEETVDLILMSPADGSEHLLKSDAWFSLQRASFSPDGRFVAFSLVREGSPPHADVLLMTADGLNEVVVAGHPAEDRFIAWTPDGRSLVFLSDRSGTRDIWTVRITGGKQEGEPELLKKDFDRNSEVLGFAPDGSLYYKTYTSLGGLYEGEIDLETGKVLKQPAQVTTRYTGAPDQLTWSPDGSNLLYVPRVSNNLWENNILTIRSATTGEEHFLLPHLRKVNQISWAPDSRSVIAHGITEMQSGIFRIDTETSAITKLADANHVAPHLCPDGKTLVFIKGGPIIAKRNLETGEESEVVKVAPTMRGYDLSPDGSEVVFQIGHVVKKLSINGGEPSELFRGLAKDTGGWWEYDLKWTRDGRFIIARACILQTYYGQSVFKGSEIWQIPAHGGTPMKLDLSVSNMSSFALHPDNRRFAFSVNDGTKEELWVLENFLAKEGGVKK
jgi:Tol biopolymer transport system component